MTSRTFPARSLPSFARSSVVFSVLLAACGSERMSLGTNETEPPPEIHPCGDGIVERDVQIARQRDLDALIGCEVIDGDVYIFQPPDSDERLDLSPLASLRRVTGSLKVEAVDSLAGLDSLEQVSNLDLLRIGSEDLTGLSKLERVYDPYLYYSPTGAISIAGCPNLRSLAGLEQLTSWNSLSINDAPALETLSGLAGPPRLEQLSLDNLPSLRNLRGLEFARVVSHLTVDGTGITTADGLGVGGADFVRFSGNPRLSHLDDVRLSTDTLEVVDNDALISANIPGLGLVRTLTIMDNDSLTELAPRGASVARGISIPPGDLSAPFVPLMGDVFEVAHNARLTRIYTPSGFSNVQQVSIWGNPALSDLQLDVLQRADGLHIVDNPSLTTLSAPQLERVGDLQVVNNPLLSTSALDGVQTFTRNMSGNADVAP